VLPTDPRAAAATPGGWTPPADGEQLTPHMPDCMGCGPEAVAGFHLEVRREGDEVVATYAFDSNHGGAPGLAHGGAVSAVCDDLLGHVLQIHGVPAVTRRLEIDYLAPVLLHESHELRARLVERDGRKLWITGEGIGGDGRERFRARGLFVQVGLEHFLAGLSPEERARAEVVYEAERGGGVSAP
jgi:acyl-coenzyme A thioesterase PaaI-like protein